MRLTHCGNSRKLRTWPSIGLHPWIESSHPALLAMPEQLRRISLYCAIGREGIHADRYMLHLNVRNDESRPHFQHTLRASAAWPLLNRYRYGVTFRASTTDYGELS